MSNIALPNDKQIATLAEFGKVILMRTAPALAKRYLIPSFPERERFRWCSLAPHMEDGGRRDPSENKMGSTLQTLGADYKKGKLILDQTHPRAFVISLATPLLKKVLIWRGIDMFDE